MTRLVLTLLVIATLIVAGILFYPKVTGRKSTSIQVESWEHDSSDQQNPLPRSLIGS